jgi:hypothetical protein
MAKKYRISLLRSWIVIISLDATAFIFTHLYLLADKLSARLKHLRSGNATR